jgi:PPK2 family polyphosphate:nucleotide phosphotransferase
MKLSQKFLIKPGKTARKLKLKDWDPGYDGGKKREDVENEMVQFFGKISKLQYKLFAANNQSLLIILQGVDTSGKDGTIRHVMGALNPQSCYVKPFRVPSAEDLSHDYLWRVHAAVPSKGQIVIFNRSHYEDVIEVHVRNLVSKSEMIPRYRQINDFERYLSENNITILKFFLHISKDEQKKRLQERLEDRTKRWKISERDLEDRKYWDKYLESYEEALNKCSTKWAPWYIIPADLKWFRNWAVAQIIIEILSSMKLKYPQPKMDLSKFVIG